MTARYLLHVVVRIQNGEDWPFEKRASIRDLIDASELLFERRANIRALTDLSGRALRKRFSWSATLITAFRPEPMVASAFSTMSA